MSNNKKIDWDARKKEKTDWDALARAFRLSRTTDTSMVDQTYIDSFMKDAGDYFDTAAKDYESISWGNASNLYNSRNATYTDLTNRADAINAWLYKNRHSLNKEAYDYYNNYLNSFYEGGKSISDVFKGYSDLMSSLDSQEAYDEWKKEQDHYDSIRSSSDYDKYVEAGKNSTGEFSKELQNLQNIMDGYGPVDFVKDIQEGDWQAIFGGVLENLLPSGLKEPIKMASAAKEIRDVFDEYVVNRSRMEQYLTTNELDMYYYYLGKGDYEAAENYYNNYANQAKMRSAAKLTEIFNSSIGETVTAFASGVDSFVAGQDNVLSKISSTLYGTEAGTKDSTALQYAFSNMRVDNEGLWKVINDLAQTLGNQLPSMLMNVVVPGSGNVAMGVSAAGNAYSEFKNNGATEAQAMIYGVTIGVLESSLQKMIGGITGLGSDGGIAKLGVKKLQAALPSLNKGLAKFALTAAGNVTGEAIEEALQEVLDPIVKNIITMNDGENESIDWGQVAYSGLLGALSAVTLETVPSAIGKGVDEITLNTKLNSLKNDPDSFKSLLTSIAMENPDVDVSDLINRYNEGQKISNKELRDILFSNERSIWNKDYNSLVDATESRLNELGEQGDVRKLAESIVKAQYGYDFNEALELSKSQIANNKKLGLKDLSYLMAEYSQNAQNKAKLSKADQKAIRESEYGSRVSNELNPNMREETSSTWAQDVKTNRLGNTAENVAKTRAALTQLNEESKSRKKLPSNAISYKSGAVDATLTQKGRDAKIEGENKSVSETYARAEGYKGLANETFSKYYKGENIEEYALGFREAYDYGLNGTVKDVKDLANHGSFKSYINEEAREMAFNAGVVDAKYTGIKSKTIKVDGDYKVTVPMSNKALSESKQATIELMKVLAPIAKVNMSTMVSLKDHGLYDPKTNTIYIDLSMDGRDVMIFTLAHELTHHLKRVNPEQFDEFARALFEEVGKTENVEERLAKWMRENKKYYPNMDQTKFKALAREEVVAEMCESFLTDEKVVQRISQKVYKTDKGLWNTIKKWFEDLVAKLKKLFADLDPQSENGRIVREMGDRLDSVKQMWADMVVEAGEIATESTQQQVKNSRKDLDEGNVIPLSQRFNEENEDIRYSRKPFAEQVDDVLNGMDTNSTHLKIMETPKLLQEAGLPDLPILMTAKHLKTITKEKGKDRANYHGLGVDIIKNLPKYINDPVMIADSLTRDDSVVIITEALDKEKRPVIAAIMLNGKGTLDSKYIDANIMTSAYGRNNFQNFINSIANNNAVIYWNKNKSQELSVNLGLQLPNIITRLDSNTIIRKVKAFVNTNLKNSENFQEEMVHSRKTVDPITSREELAKALSKVAKGEDRAIVESYKANVNLIKGETERLESLRKDIDEIKYKKSITYEGRELSVKEFEQITYTRAEEMGIDAERVKFKALKESGKYIATVDGNKILEAEKRFRTKDDIDKLATLEHNYQATIKRITTYDKKLLQIEAMSSIKQLINREKKASYDKAKAEGKEALKEYKAQAIAEQKKITERYQEMRKKNVEGRKTTEMRHKLMNTVHTLDQLLVNPTKKKHIPIALQKPVAEALNILNTDTVGAEERLAKITAELKTTDNPVEIEQLLKRYNRIKAQGDKIKEKIDSLKAAYDKLLASEDEIIRNSHDEVISNMIQNASEKIGDKAVRDMTYDELEMLYKMYRAILKTVRDANTSFKMAKGEEISTLGQSVMGELAGFERKNKEQIKLIADIKDGAEWYQWNNLKPIYAFKRIGSSTLETLYNNVREGEDVWAVDMSEARAFSDAEKTKFGYSKWDMDKSYTFQTRSAKDFKLTLGQIMSIYAYTKRGEQAINHLVEGGFVYDGTTEIKKNVKGNIEIAYELKDSTAYRLSEEIIGQINATLTPAQKSFVDSMQNYLSTVMGEKGNEVSLALYDIKLFGEKNYFPLKSSQVFLERAREQARGEVKVKNKGFTKETTPKANNPIVLESFMDVWANHCVEMGMYHAFTLPLEDFYRVYNYKERATDEKDSESVIMHLENAFGNSATKYIDQLLVDINGGTRADPRINFSSRWIAKFKKAKTFLSASVVIQQPSAVTRAMALIDGKYFVEKPTNHKATWNEIKKYAPVAIIKEMGYFDTGMGLSSKDWLKNEPTKMEKMEEALSKAPAYADEIGWNIIWRAVKREVAATTNLKVNSEEFLQRCGERFTEVITMTQVYDSVFARSSLMRSKDGLAKMLTAFMAEPTTTINMLTYGLNQRVRGNKGVMSHFVGACLTSAILNSMLVSIVYAARDDDEDEEYWERYFGALGKQTIDSVNVLKMMPFIKDMVSIFEGFTVSRTDVSLITDIYWAWQKLDNDNVSAYKKVEDFAGSIAAMFGVPLKNLMRDLRALWNLITSSMK